MVLLAARLAVATAPTPCPTANSLPPPAGIAPVPVVKLKFANPLMFSVTVSDKAMPLELPNPTRKLELLLPPLTTSGPAPEIVRLLVMAAAAFGLPTMNAPLTLELRPVSAELLATFKVAPLPIVSVLAAALFVADLKLLTAVLAPLFRFKLPTGSFVLVPEFGVPSETR